MKTETSVQKLCERINSELELNVNYNTFRRVYAGHWQRTRGAWSWWLYQDDGRVVQVGSQYPVKRLLKAKELTKVYLHECWHIDPKD